MVSCPILFPPSYAEDYKADFFPLNVLHECLKCTHNFQVFCTTISFKLQIMDYSVSFCKHIAELPVVPFRALLL